MTNIRITIVGLLLAAWADAGTTAAEPAWADRRAVGVFRCRADFPLRDVRATLDELPQLAVDVCRSLWLPAPTQPIDVYLFRDQAAMVAYLRQHLPQVPYRRALFVQDSQGSRVLAFRSPQFAVDLRHECTHALLHSAVAEVPLWLDEGLAVYFEQPPARRASGSPALSELRSRLQVTTLPQLADVEAKASLVEFGRNEYLHSWAWVHFLLHGPPDARAALALYVAELRNGPAAVPLSVRLERQWPDATARAANHIRGWK
jgi:hypothetical protein